MKVFCILISLFTTGLYADDTALLAMTEPDLMKKPTLSFELVGKKSPSPLPFNAPSVYVGSDKNESDTVDTTLDAPKLVDTSEDVNALYSESEEVVDSSGFDLEEFKKVLANSKRFLGSDNLSLSDNLLASSNAAVEDSQSLAVEDAAQEVDTVEKMPEPTLAQAQLNETLKKSLGEEVIAFMKHADLTMEKVRNIMERGIAPMASDRHTNEVLVETSIILSELMDDAAPYRFQDSEITWKLQQIQRLNAKFDQFMNKAQKELKLVPDEVVVIKAKSAPIKSEDAELLDLDKVLERQLQSFIDSAFIHGATTVTDSNGRRKTYVHQKSE